jgi:transposase
MSSIVSKLIAGRAYYYLVESARVDGKPRIVSQRYLGSAEEVAARLSGSGTGEPDRSRHLAFGEVAAVLSVLRRLRVAEIIDEVVGPRRSDALASVGTYISLVVANRIAAPCSKLAFEKWWVGTVGPRLTKLPASAVEHRRFWDAMEALDTEALREIECRIAAHAAKEFDLDLSGLVLDMTNFATFIDSGNEAAPIAKRGHAKQKRMDLRLVGLALIVTADGAVPVVSHAYAGNRPDVTQFPCVLSELAERYKTVASGLERLTVVYDAGCNSAANQELIESSGLSFVGSLVVSQHPELLAVSRSRFSVVDEKRFPGLSAFEAEATALGAKRRVIVTHSDTFHSRQVRGFTQTVSTAMRRLDELARRLAGGKTTRSAQRVAAEVAEILAPRWLHRVIRTELTGDSPRDLRLSFALDAAARRRLEREIFGKRILFTDRKDWAVAEVVAAYRSQSIVESGFRQLKDVKVISFSPMFHWTEAKIRVHMFYCVLALTVAHLMRRQAAAAGIDLSVRELVSSLAGIQETVLLYEGERGRPRARRMLTEMDADQQRLYDLFGLATYAPTR